MARRLSPQYRPRDPTQTVLYQVIDQHLASFISEVEAADRPLPGFVRRELEGLVRCGRLEWGFAVQKCPACTFERLIGLPCRGRALCCSCAGRRMIAGAARLVDHIFPNVPVRQWVCSFPPRLRFAMAFDHELCSRVIGIFVAEVMRWQRHTAKRELGLASVDQAHGASVVATHRAGSSLNLQLHVHGAFVDGVFVASSSAHERAPEFRALPAPTRDDLREIAWRAYAKTKRKLRALGRDWEEDTDSSALDDATVLSQEPLLIDCAQASINGVGLLDDQAGVPLAPRVRDPLALPADLAHFVQDEHPGGFNLHAARRVSAGDRAGLERLLRYILHPALAHDRLQWTDDGHVRLRFTRPWRNGVDSMVLTPHNLIARLVPIVPRPGTHQLRYYGLFARRAELRRFVIPPRAAAVVQTAMFDRRGGPTPRARRQDPPKPEPGTSSEPTFVPAPEAEITTTHPAAPAPPLARLAPMGWAEAQRRMSDYDVENCPRCGARLAPVVVVLDPGDIHRTLELRASGGPVPLLSQAPARGPPHGQLPLPFAGPAASRAPAAA